MRKISNKVLSMLVVLCLVLTSISFTVFAEEAGWSKTIDFTADPYASLGSLSIAKPDSDSYTPAAVGTGTNVWLRYSNDQTGAGSSTYFNGAPGAFTFSSSGVQLGYNTGLNWNRLPIGGLEFDGFTSDVSDTISIKTTMQKGNSNATIGQMFMKHNAGKNYYGLVCYRGSESGTTGYVAQFIKVVDNAVVATVNGPAADSSKGGNGCFSSTELIFDVKITDKSTITWKVSGNRAGFTGTQVWEGSYVDKKPFAVSVKDTSIFYSTNGSGAASSIKKIEMSSAKLKTSIEKEDTTIYSTDFDGEEFVTGEYDLSASGSTQIGTSPWYIVNSQSPLGGHLSIDVVDTGDGNKVLQTNGTESNSGFVYRQSYLKLNDPNVYSKLTDKYQITVEGNKSNVYTVPMFRFAGKDQSNYYMLTFNCDRAVMNSQVKAASTDGTWAVYKVAGDVSTRLFGSDQTGYLGTNNSYHAVIKVEGKKITVTANAASCGVVNETKSYTVDEWLQADPTKTYVGFAANRPYGTGSQTLIRSYKLENVSNLGLKDDEAYIDVATSLDSNNIMDLGKKYSFKKFVNKSSSPVDVYLSPYEDGNYLKLGTIPAEGELVNDITAATYRTVKLSAAADVSVYIPVDTTITLPKNNGSLSIIARVGGVDLDSPTLTTSANGYVSDGKIYGSALGELTIYANGTEVGKVTVTAAKDEVVDCTQYSDVALTALTHEDDENGKNYTPIVLNSDWTFKMTDSDSVSQAPMNGWGKAGVSDNGVNLIGTQFDQTTHCAYPALFYTGSLSGLKKDFTMRIKLSESSALAGQMIRFMVHNGGRNYYQIELPGNVRNNSGYDYAWVFHKVENGKQVARVNGPSEGFDGGTYGANGTFNGDITTTITVSQDGMISWTINGKRQGIYESAHDFVGSYCDSNMFSVNQEDANICILATANSDDRVTYVKELKFLSAEELLPISIAGDTISINGFDDVAAFGEGTPYGFTFVEFGADGTVVNIETIDKEAGDSAPIEYTMTDPANTVKSFIIDAWDTLVPLFKSFKLN